MSLDLSLPDDWRTWDPQSKDRLIWRLRCEAIIQGKTGSWCFDATPSAMAARILGHRWHHRNYHDVLDQMALDLESGVIEMACVSTPPQIGKSTWVNWYVAWRMARHPEDPVIRMSYAASLATKHGRYVQDIVTEHGGQFGLLPKRGAWAQHEWETMTGAALRSGGMLTGVSGYPAALMLLDDPLSGRAQADSKLLRDKVWDEYSGSLVSRMRPGAPLLMVATRWHEDDPIGRLIKAHGDERKGGKVRVINLAALAREDDPLGRSVGEPLQHPWIDPEDVAAARKHWETQRQRSTLRDWNSLYQGDPRPVEGALLTEEQVRAATHEGELPEFVRTGVAVDPSGGGRDVAGVIGGGVTADGKVYWTHDRSGSMGSDEWTEAACELAHELEANEIVYEKNYGGDQAKFLLRSVWAKLSAEAVAAGGEDWGPCPRIVQVNAKKAKRVRAEPIAVQVALGNVKFWGLFVLDLGSEWCFAAGTMVTTVRGDVPIEDVRVGDMVATRQGWKRVQWSGQTGVRRTITNHFSDGRTIRSTPDHKFWTDQGWVEAQDLSSCHMMDVWNPSSIPHPETSDDAPASTAGSSTKAKTATGRPTSASAPAVVNDYSIVSSGHTPMDLFRTGTMSITETTIGGIIDSTTLNLSSAPSTSADTRQACHSGQCQTSNGSNGSTGGPVESRAQRTATGAGTPSNPQGCEPDSAARRTPTRTSTPTEPETGTLNGARERTSDSVPTVEQTSVPAGLTLSSAGLRAEGHSAGLREPVYDLTVEDAHEFYANGILVHNCTWQEDSKESPGRIDASSYLGYRWLKIPGAESNVSTSGLDELPKAATGKGSLAGRRMSRGR